MLLCSPRRLATIALGLAALAAPLPALGQTPPPSPGQAPPAPPQPPSPPGPALPPPGPLPPVVYGTQAPMPYGQAPYVAPPAPRFAPPAQELPPPDESRGQIDGGFVLEANLGARVSLATFASNGEGAPLGSPGLQVSLLAGAKIGRVILGLDLGFYNFTESGGGASISESALLLGPELQVALARSDDRRVELLGDAGIQLGHLFFSGGDIDVDDGNLYVSYQLGLGVRYWLHRQFAVQGLTGFGGEALVDTDQSGATSAHGIFTSLGLLGVF